MDFKEKYTLDKVKEPNKVEISKESYAIAELLNEILIKINLWARKL